jgi:coenzyme F420-reducing hydrogenase beta subunit
MDNPSGSIPNETSSYNQPVKGKLCSSCGLCMVREWPAEESSKSCVFKNGWLGEQEAQLFGRERSVESMEETRFGISRKRFIGRIRNPLPNVQFSGIITSIAKKAFETGMVEAVATLHRSKEDYFLPQPVLARSTEEILASGGSKPVVAPVLVSLQTAYQQGIKRLLVISAPCHVHALRDFKRRFSYLKDMEIYHVGIPCTDNTDPKKFRRMLGKMSRSHQTVRFFEFMQDYTVHLRHENGWLERVPFFSLPREASPTAFHPPACRGCLDYMNSLADITVGYMGAPLKKEIYQWVVVRTERGEELCTLIADELETLPEETGGDCRKAVKNTVLQMIEKVKPGGAAEVKTGRKIPIWAGKIMAAIMKRIGPRGLEYARYGIDMHLMMNYYYLKYNYPELLTTLVPKHVYHVIKEYDLAP